MATECRELSVKRMLYNQKVNNKGMKIVKVPTNIKNILDIDNSDNLFKEYFDRNELRVDNTKIYL